MKLEENIYYKGWPNCIRLCNAEVEIIIATEIGLRILHFGFIGGENIFYLDPDSLGKTGGSAWLIYGGHRLWHAPEEIPRTYSPDNESVSYSYSDNTLIITQPIEPLTGIVKEMEICLSPDRNEVKILHRLINKSSLPIRLSPWAISALAPGGRAIIPQEPFGEGDKFLLPVRCLSLWSYTSMQDPRWTWGNSFIQARQNHAFDTEQKIGILNKQGWTAYNFKDNLLIKIFDYDPGVEYPDFNVNNEVYINGKFLEIETLGSYAEILPDSKSEHLEHWNLSRARLELTEELIGLQLFPLVSVLKKSYPG